MLMGTMSYNLLNSLKTFTALSTGEFLVIENENEKLLKIKY